MTHALLCSWYVYTLGHADENQQLGAMGSDRLGEYRRLLAAAVLRAYEAPLISDDYLHEDLASGLLSSFRGAQC